MTQDFIISFKGENISHFGRLDIHKCSNCDFETFILGLYPEMDGIGTGIVGLSDKEQNVLLITQLSSSEYANFKTELPKSIEYRIGNIFTENNFKHYVRKEFMPENLNEKYLSYSCPKCQKHLNKCNGISFVEFVDGGGKVWTFENYEKYKIN